MDRDVMQSGQSHARHAEKLNKPALSRFHAGHVAMASIFTMCTGQDLEQSGSLSGSDTFDHQRARKGSSMECLRAFQIATCAGVVSKQVARIAVPGPCGCQQP